MQATAMLIVANRLLPLDRAKAKALLSEVAKQKKYDSVFPRYDDKLPLSFDTIDAVVWTDKDFGKRFILQTYLLKQSEYAENFIGNLKKFLKYSQHCGEQNIENVLFRS